MIRTSLLSSSIAVPVGHFALVEPLLPKLRAQKHPSRVVLVSSMGHLFQVRKPETCTCSLFSVRCFCYTHGLVSERPVGMCGPLASPFTLTVSMSCAQRNPLDLDDLHYEKRSYGRIAAYGQSKAANVMFAKQVADM